MTITHEGLLKDELMENHKVATKSDNLVKLLATDHSAAVFAKHADRLNKSATDIAKLKTEVEKITSGFDIKNPESISKFGSGTGQRVINYSDKLLAQVKAKDVEGVGEKLSDVVLLAKNINVKSLVGGTASRVPFIGGWIDKMKYNKEKLITKYDTLSGQIDKIVVEIGSSQKRLSQRITDMENIYNFNVEEYHNLDVMILAGEIKLAELEEEISTRKASPSSVDSMEAQQISDVQDIVVRLEKRVHDLRTMQLVSVQTAPMIRMVQSNNRILIDKFNNLQELTIPSWKKQFTVAIALMEQKKAVELTQKIDDATNDLLMANADLLKQNTISSAKAAQRAVVDIETLEHVQQTLIDTVAEVRQIQRDGEVARQQAVTRMEAMKTDLIEKMNM